MSETHKAFPMAAVLSVYYNRRMTAFESMRGLVDWMCGTRVGLWDYARARKLCAQDLYLQYPWLDDHPPVARGDLIPQYVRRVQRNIGAEELDVAPLRQGCFKSRTMARALR